MESRTETTPVSKDVDLLKNQILIEETTSPIGRFFSPLIQDFKEMEPSERPRAILSALGALAVIPINALHLRTIAMMTVEVKTAGSISPLLIAPSDTIFHYAWSRLYFDREQKGAKALPHTTAAFGKRMRADKVDFTGLEPGSTQVPADIEQRHKRLLKSFELRGKRGLYMLGTSTMAYIVAAALQKQPESDQKKLAKQASTESTLVSLGKGFLMADGVAITNMFSSGFSKGYYAFAETFMGSAAINVGTMATVLGISHAIEKYKQHRGNSRTAAELDEASIKPIALLPQFAQSQQAA